MGLLTRFLQNVTLELGRLLPLPNDRQKCFRMIVFKRAVYDMRANLKMSKSVQT